MRFRTAAVAVLLCVIAGAMPAFAQDQPKADLFVGYSYLHPNVRAGEGIPGGFGTALTFNPSKPLGLTADFGFHRKNGLNVTTFLFGPKLTARGEKAMPFLEALFGGARLSAAGSGTTTSPRAARRRTTIRRFISAPTRRQRCANHDAAGGAAAPIATDTRTPRDTPEAPSPLVPSSFATGPTGGSRPPRPARGPRPGPASA